MFAILGLLIVFGSVTSGYLLHGGHIAVLIQVSEFIIIFEAGIGALVIANPPALVKRILRELIALVMPNPYSEKSYAQLLQVLYDVFQTARKEGLVGLEPHIEESENSLIFRKYPIFSANHYAVAFLADTLKVLLSGAVEDHNLSEILEVDLDQQHEESMAVPHAFSRVGVAMPGFGIVVAVLGVVITMGSIGGSPTEIGEKVAAASSEPFSESSSRMAPSIRSRPRSNPGPRTAASRSCCRSRRHRPMERRPRRFEGVQGWRRHPSLDGMNRMDRMVRSLSFRGVVPVGFGLVGRCGHAPRHRAGVLPSDILSIQFIPSEKRPLARNSDTS